MLTRNQIHLFHYKLRHCRVGPRATGLSQGICHWGAAWLSTSHIAFCTIILSPSPSLLSQLMACFQGTNCLSLPVFSFFFGQTYRSHTQTQSSTATYLPESKANGLQHLHFLICERKNLRRATCSWQTRFTSMTSSRERLFLHSRLAWFPNTAG